MQNTILLDAALMILNIGFFQLENFVMRGRGEGSAIKKCYTEFVVISNPIIGRKEVNSLVDLYKSKTTNHFNTLHQMLGFKRKEGLTRNKHLKVSVFKNCRANR